MTAPLQCTARRTGRHGSLNAMMKCPVHRPHVETAKGMAPTQPTRGTRGLDSPELERIVDAAAEVKAQGRAYGARQLSRGMAMEQLFPMLRQGDFTESDVRYLYREHEDSDFHIDRADNASLTTAIADSPSTPLDILRELAKHQSSTVRAKAGCNPRFPVHELAKMARTDESPAIVNHLVSLRGHEIPPNVLGELARRTPLDPALAMNLARCLGLPRDAAKHLNERVGSLIGSSLRENGHRRLAHAFEIDPRNTAALVYLTGEDGMSPPWFEVTDKDVAIALAVHVNP